MAARSDNPLIALVDCNNFYVSCERVFRPDLIGKPVAVLSNNDGCIVARSQEVKALGIKMGVPLYQVQDLVKRHDIRLFSSNYTLYADMSARVMAVLEAFTPSLEIYSIDEAFLDLTGVYPCFLDPVAYGQEMKASVLKMTGIPVCVGMAPTKTLAKLANFAAKKWPKTQGVVDLSDRTRRNRLLAVVPVGEVWGVGHRIAQRLNALGILSASDLAQQPVDYIKQQFNVVLARTVMELNGVACLSLDEVVPAKQQIVCSRSFGYPLLAKEALASVLAEFSVRVSEKLRKQQSLAQHVSIFIRTNPFNLQEKQYQRAASLKLPISTQDTRVIIKATLRLLNEIYQPGFAYHKAGVQLGQINPVTTFHQLHLFESLELFQDNRHDLMETVDRINRKFPKKLGFAATCIDRTWLPKRGLSSPRYTTCWQELAVVSCR